MPKRAKGREEEKRRYAAIGKKLITSFQKSEVLIIFVTIEYENHRVYVVQTVG